MDIIRDLLKNYPGIPPAQLKYLVEAKLVKIIKKKHDKDNNSNSGKHYDNSDSNNNLLGDLPDWLSQ